LLLLLGGEPPWAGYEHQLRMLPRTVDVLQPGQENRKAAALRVVAIAKGLRLQCYLELVLLVAPRLLHGLHQTTGEQGGQGEVHRVH
jgi:hypothetical protein